MARAARGTAGSKSRLRPFLLGGARAPAVPAVQAPGPPPTVKYW